jgi:holo-[acyl-carrier protein] synthase
MIIGFGNDLQLISEVQRLIEEQDSFIPRILTKNEQAQLQTRFGKKIAEYVADRFSAKEAYAKATGYGIGEHARWQDIEILSDDEGKPNIVVSGKSQIPEANNYLVAISHSGGYVLTNVIVEKN